MKLYHEDIPINFGNNKPFSEYIKQFRESGNNKEVYYTPKNLYDQGIVLCSDCGRMGSIDYKFCKHCNDDIIIILEDKQSEK